jgi:carboxylate-amine ligase
VTLGVELELQILDRTTDDLAPGALRVLDACAEEKIEGVSEEFLLSMLEVKTGICRNVAEVRDFLFPLLRRVRNVASSLGYDLAVGGTHPFSRPGTGAVFPDERYERLRRRQGWLAYQETVFGLHIHVGVPGGDEAVGLINLLVPYLPHLLALSANSPFWNGVDTGFASARATMFRPSAHAGLPQHFADWREFGRYYQVMREARAIEATKDIYWDIRPRPGLGTIEFRICDAPPSLSCLLALAALVRSLAIEGLRLLRNDPGLRGGDPSLYWLALENRWLAARFGLRAECVFRPGGKRTSLTEDTARLVERLLPIADAAGDRAFLDALQPLSRFETGADRQRGLYRRTGDWQAVIDELKNRWVGEVEAEGEAVNLR